MRITIVENGKVVFDRTFNDGDVEIKTTNEREDDFKDIEQDLGIEQ